LVIFRKKAQYISMKTCYSLSGWGIWNISLCLHNSNSGQTRKIC
jgi:hypothetical protein